MHVGGNAGAMHVRARPAHVEVLDGDGHRQVIHVRDVETILVVAITLAGAAGAYALRIIRTRRQAK